MASSSDINAKAMLFLQVARDQTMTCKWQMPSEILDRVIVTIPQQTQDFQIRLQPANGDKVLFIGIQGDFEMAFFGHSASEGHDRRAVRRRHTPWWV